VLTARIVEARGELVGALMVRPEDEVFAITSAGGVIRTSAAEIKMSGRQTMGVRLVNLASGQSLVALARNAEALEGNGDGDDAGTGTDGGETGTDGGTDAPGSGNLVAAAEAQVEETDVPAANSGVNNAETGNVPPSEADN